MTDKEAHLIRLQKIAQLAESVTTGIIDKSKVKELDMEISAMLRHLSSSKRFFKRLA